MAVSIVIDVTKNSQSVANNTTNVTVKVNAKWTNGSFNLTQKSGSCTIDGTKYTFTSAFNTGQTTSGSCNLFTKTLDITHKSDGTKTLAISASYTSGVSSGTVAASASVALTTIPRKSTLSVGNGTLGTAQTLTVTRNSSSFTHTITYTCGSASGTICTKSTSTSISFTPPLSLANQNTTGTSVSVKYTITTYNGSTSLGSNSYTKTCSIPASVKPTVTLTVSDPMGYASTYGYLQGLSKVSVSIATSNTYGASIKSYKTTVAGKNYTANSFTTDILSSTGSVTISTTVTDSRGRTGTASKTVTFVAYTTPKITVHNIYRSNSAGKDDSAGAHLAIRFSSGVTSLSDKNTATYTVQYKKTSATAYTSATLTTYANNYAVNNGLYVFAADTASSYDVIFTVSDKFKSVPKSFTGSSVKKLFSILKGGLGFAFGKIAELSNTLDIAFSTLFREHTTYKNDKAIYGTTVDGSATYSALIPVTTSGNLALGYGLYAAGKGTTNIYGNDINFYTKTGYIRTNTNKLVFDNNTCIYGTKPDGTIYEAINPQNSNGNLVLGYDNYDNKNGQTNIYGYDVNIGVSNIATPNSYRPYLRRGDSVAINYQGAGYLTNGGKEVHIMVPLSKPVAGSPTVTVKSVGGCILRQENKYTHGSGASTAVTPSTLQGYSYHNACLRVILTFSSTTNAINNSSIGVHFDGIVEFS